MTNMTNDWKIIDGRIFVPDREPGTMRPHDSAPTFEDQGDALDWIESVEERFAEQEERYLEENHHAIVQQERYELWRNEY
jgi:hypothetical protein